MKVGVPRETASGERRVALTPDGVRTLRSIGFAVLVERGAGSKAFFSDSEYADAGAELLDSHGEILSSSDLLLRVMGPSDGSDRSEVVSLRSGSALLGFLSPLSNPQTTHQLAQQGVSSFAIDLMPRISRAQSMDALSSMSTIAGYKAVLLAADALPKFFPMLTTAAGTIRPARVFVIGAGVAGLQAIATARRLGAVVEAFDVRPAVKEQVESLGARFVGMQLLTEEAEDASGYAKEVGTDTLTREMDLIASRLSKTDVVITTALIPGKPAPTLITRDMLKQLAPGAVVMDLAAISGGNCEATVPGKTVSESGVTVIGRTDLLSEMSSDASRMYSKNVTEFVKYLSKDGQITINLEDEIIRETLITHDGRIIHDPIRLAIESRGKA